MTVDVIRQHVLPRLDRIRPVGGGFKASCPVPGHGKGSGDRNPSLSIAPGDKQPVVFRCQAGCDQDAVKAALIGLGIDWDLVSQHHADEPQAPDTWMPCGYDRDTKQSIPGHRKVAEYLYRDRRGAVVFGTARCALKGNGCDGFRQWRPDPTSKSGKRWSRTLPDGSKVGVGLPYRLPELMAAIADDRTVFLAEGEKDADRLAQLGYPATCNAEGAGKWTAAHAAHAAHLAGADVVIVADRDAPGWAHAEQVVESLMPLARSIEVVRAAEGKDASDHLDAGLKVHQFVRIAEPLAASSVVPGCPDCATEAGT